MSDSHIDQACLICHEAARVIRSNNHTYVNCSSGAEYLMSHRMLEILTNRSGALERRHNKAKGRKEAYVYIIVRLGDHPQEVSEFQLRSKWL